MRIRLVGLMAGLLLLFADSSGNAAFHLWQIQEVFTNANGTVQFIEMHDNNPGETTTNGFKVTANADGNIKTVTLANLSHPTPGSLLFATSGFGSLMGGITPDFTFPSTSFFNPNANNITISFNGSSDSISFTGASLPHDGIHSLTDANLYGTPNLVSAINSPMNLVGNSGSVNLSSPTGDYNGNHVVDGADYVVWRKTLNSTASPAGMGADGNGDGTINAADYTFWRQKFGSAAGAGATVSRFSTVPEPVGLGFSLGWLLVLNFKCQRNRYVNGGT